MAEIEMELKHLNDALRKEPGSRHFDDRKREEMEKMYRKQEELMRGINEKIRHRVL